MTFDRRSGEKKVYARLECNLGKTVLHTGLFTGFENGKVIEQEVE